MKRITGNKWDGLLAEEWQKPYYQELRSFLIEEYKNGTVYTPAGDIYNALRLTDYDDVKAVILGQDPYHEPGQAHGLAFSVPVGVTAPPSLVNNLKELESDTGCGAAPGEAGPPAASSGSAAVPSGPPAAQNGSAAAPSGASSVRGILDPWAKQGVLLLNTVLTVRAHQAGSHRGKGWEQFTDRIIELLASRQTPMVFILWGANAGAKEGLILKAQGEHRRHLIIKAPHPSPLSAYRGFFGGSYFSRCNYFLEDNGIEPVDWSL